MIEETSSSTTDYSVEAGLLPTLEGGFMRESFRHAAGDALDTNPTCTVGGLANRNDVVGDEPSFPGDDQPHRNAFRFVVVASMQQVHDSNSRAKT